MTINETGENVAEEMENIAQEAAEPDDEINVAAVIFRNMSANSMTKLAKGGDTPYFYLNIIGAKLSDLCLVHNGDNFAVVEVKRIINYREDAAMARVTKPLLSVIKYDQELLSTATDRLKEFLERTEGSRIDKAIDAALYTPQKKGIIDGELLVRLAALGYTKEQITSITGMRYPIYQLPPKAAYKGKLKQPVDDSESEAEYQIRSRYGV